VLDEFKSAGVFVNWWQQIRYDLKTIVSNGWHHTLISYLIAEFFKAEAAVIEGVEAKINEAQNELAGAIETAQQVAAYEFEEDETITAAVIKKALKELIDDLKDSSGDSARKELKRLREQDDAISALEKRIREGKAELKRFTDELDFKLQLKRLGGDEFKAESKELLAQVETRLATLDESKKEDKKEIARLQRDKSALQTRMAKTDALLASIGGQLTDTAAKALILKKLHDLANVQLNRYLNDEKRVLVQAVKTFGTNTQLPAVNWKQEQPRL
jgi:type I restriction enzyme M protein